MSKLITVTPEAAQQQVLAGLEAPFELQLVAGSIKGAMKVSNAGSKDLWQVPVTAIKVLAGYQAKVHNKTYIARVHHLAESMVEIGWLDGSVLSGYTATVEGESEPVIYVIGGHTRLLALEIANKARAKRGLAPIDSVPMSVNTKGVSMDDLNVQMIRGNENGELAPYEQGIVCKRLLGAGHDEKAVQLMTGVKDPWFSRLMLLMAAPNKLKQMVAFEVIAATFAIEMIEEHGPKALKVIEEVQAELAAKTKPGPDGVQTPASEIKVSKKHMPKTPEQQTAKVFKKLAPVMHITLREVQADPGFSSLSKENQETIMRLMDELKDVKEETTEANTSQASLLDAVEDVAADAQVAA